MGKIKQTLFALVDISSTKIVCFIARVSVNGEIEVVGVGQSRSEGIHSGVIAELCKAEKAILKAVHAAEQMAGVTIESIIVNISGNKTKSYNLTVTASSFSDKKGNKLICNEDIEVLIDKAYAQFDAELYEVIHCIPINYVVDDDNVVDPRGMYGKTLKAQVHVLATATTMILNLTNCLTRCHLDILGCIASPYATGVSCLGQDERDIGTVVIDMGSCHTSIGVFANGHFIYNDHVMLGGTHVTNDIAWGFSVSVDTAEKIKIKYGTLLERALYAEEKIEVSQVMGGNQVAGNVIYVTKEQIRQVMTSRIEETLMSVKKRLDNSGLSVRAMGRIVLTGGASQVEGVEDVARKVFGRHIVVASPKQIMGVPESMRGPAYAAMHGMLMLVATQTKDIISKDQSLLRVAANNAMGRVVGWIKESF